MTMIWLLDNIFINSNHIVAIDYSEIPMVSDPCEHITSMLELRYESEPIRLRKTDGNVRIWIETIRNLYIIDCNDTRKKELLPVILN